MPLLSEFILAKKNNSLTQTITDSTQTVAIDEQEAQARAGGAGIMTPLGISTTGGNPDQAKMGSTPAQKMASLSSAIQYGVQEEMDFDTAQRRELGTRKAEKQEGAAGDVGAFQGAMNLDDRVNRLTEQYISDAVQEAASTMNTENVRQLSNMDAIQERLDRANARRRTARGGAKLRAWEAANRAYADLEAARELEAAATGVWDSLQAGSSPDPVQLDTLKKAIAEQEGVADPSSISDEKIKEFLSVDMEEIELGKNLTGAELLDADPALRDELAASLGLSLPEINAMTVRELQDAIHSVGAQSFDTGAEMQALISNPATGDAERAMYEQMAADFGTFSGEEAERQFQEILQSVDEADTIEFGGQQYTIGEMFDDAEFTKAVAAYFQDPEKEAEFKENEPQLAAFLDKHSELLEQMTKNINIAETRIDEMVAEAGDVLNTPDGSAIPDNILEAAFGYVPDPSNLQQRDWLERTENNSLYQMYKDPTTFASLAGATAEEVQSFKDLIPALTSIDPNFLSSISDKSPSELYNEYLKDEGNGSNLEQAVAASQEINRIANMPIETEDQQNAFFRTVAGTDMAGLAELLETGEAVKRMGHERPAALDILDADKDGILDDPAAIRERMLNANGDNSLESLINNGVQGLFNPEDVKDMGSNLDATILAAVRDGEIDKKELNGMTTAQLQEVSNNHSSLLAEGVSRNTVHTLIQDSINKDTANALKAMTGSPFENFHPRRVEVMKERLSGWMGANGRGEWYANTDPKQYQFMRQQLHAYMKDVTPQYIQSITDPTAKAFVKSMYDLYTKDNAQLQKGIRAMHPNDAVSRPDKISQADFDTISNMRFPKWRVWDTTQTPAKLLGGHSDPNVVAKWQQEVMEGKRRPDDISGLVNPEDYRIGG